MNLTISTIDYLPFTTTRQKLYWDDTIKGLGICLGQATKTWVVKNDVKDLSTGFNRIKNVKIGQYNEITPKQSRNINIIPLTKTKPSLDGQVQGGHKRCYHEN